MQAIVKVNDVDGSSIALGSQTAAAAGGTRRLLSELTLPKEIEPPSASSDGVKGTWEEWYADRQQLSKTKEEFLREHLQRKKVNQVDLVKALDSEQHVNKELAKLRVEATKAEFQQQAAAMVV